MPLLGDLVSVKKNVQDADFFVVCKGKDIGKPLKEFQNGTLGVKVTAVEQLVPAYLYYWFEYIYGQGAFRNTTNLIPDDLKRLEVVNRPEDS